jgi:hypothetical protein
MPEQQCATPEEQQAKRAYEFMLEEYKTLRTGVDKLVRDTRQLELYVVGALVAYYAWMLTHCIPSPDSSEQLTLRDVAGYLPVLLPLLGAWRSAADYMRITTIATYIRGIEDDCLRGSPLNGYEHHLIPERHARPLLGEAHVLLWAVLFILTFGIAVYSKTLFGHDCEAAEQSQILKAIDELRTVKPGEAKN